MGIFNNKIDITELYPKGFVDIHSHLLPGIDDGAKNIEDSLALIERLQKQGINNFRITPHVLGGVWENSSSVIKEKEADLRKVLKEKGFDNVNIHAAAEYMLDDHFSALLDNNDILPLKDKYILVEMSFFNPPFNLDDLLFQIQVKGYVPVLAHPERYNYYHNNMSQYEKLIEAGCLFQLNLLSLTEQYGKPTTKIAYELLKKGMYTFTGTDTHHKRHVHLMNEIATKKNKKLLTPLFENNIKTFSF
ncbi:tyrosine-protein phosphatase [Wenyingzhuangia marina]|uniref:protein-tyrosine-phosphatase n=1 Tax=Wenyingzhuangia marina TaxID=1195760 RepID=A0A1M5WR39_9FLAO|nr:CpsB/CapC family capsule biosynthesis tyrosine phosphatase [Wenyingzhuangia marina]GGF80183.1 capsular polysaccharide biosynthesis protein [Wenyingzhuangia marina]SHH90076.1 Tyrosine-protein phosphatase YwqE [Wenyingzhuangia marina]